MPAQSEIGYDSKIEGDFIVTRIDAALNWFAKTPSANAMGLACCAIELMARRREPVRYFPLRFGGHALFAATIDVMIVAGTVTYKMATAVKRIYDQMPSEWVIAWAPGAHRGMYRSYSVLQGVDNIIPVDVYVAAVRRGPKPCSMR